jgi:hypothetical protein
VIASIGVDGSAWLTGVGHVSPPAIASACAADGRYGATAP